MLVKMDVGIFSIVTHDYMIVCHYTLCIVDERTLYIVTKIWKFAVCLIDDFVNVRSDLKGAFRGVFFNLCAVRVATALV